MVIVLLAPRAGKVTQILRCDWLHERARWSYLARSGLPSDGHRKFNPVQQCNRYFDFLIVPGENAH